MASRPRPVEQDAIAAVLDDFHDAASCADCIRYFGHFATNGVFLGTDASERWSLPEFRAYAEPHFSSGRGWTYVALDRNVYIASCGRMAWFDEKLMNEKYGECRGSGVLVMCEGVGKDDDEDEDEDGGGDGGVWKIAQYNLTVPIPNDMLADVARRIRKFDATIGRVVPTSQRVIDGETRNISETPPEDTSKNTVPEETQNSKTMDSTSQRIIAGESQDLSETLENSCFFAKEPPSSRSFRPKASALPTSLVRTFQLESDDVDDDGTREVIPSTVIIQLFSDRIFISISQLSGKMGSLLVCNVEESIIDNSTTYHISTLLGTGTSRGGGGPPEQEVSLREVYVRRLAERIVSHARRMAGVREGAILGGAENGTSPIPPLVVGLGLRPNKSGKKLSFESFNAIIDTTIELYEEGWKICRSGGMVGMEGPD